MTKIDQLSLLLVEDDLISGFIAEQVINETVYFKDYTWLKNGEDAVTWMKENHADLVLLDLSMPVMDGFEVLEALQEHQPIGSHNIFILTSSDRSLDKQNTLKYSNVKGYIQKPLTKEKLDEAVAIIS